MGTTTTTTTCTPPALSTLKRPTRRYIPGRGPGRTPPAATAAPQPRIGGRAVWRRSGCLRGVSQRARLETVPHAPSSQVGDFLQGYGPGHVYEHHSAEISRTGAPMRGPSLPTPLG